MYKILLGACIALSLSANSFASKEVGCKCNNGMTRTPDCGICGTLAGTMEKNASGVDCICSTKMHSFKSHEISCEATCQRDGGWSGQFED